MQFTVEHPACRSANVSEINETGGATWTILALDINGEIDRSLLHWFPLLYVLLYAGKERHIFGNKDNTIVFIVTEPFLKEVSMLAVIAVICNVARHIIHISKRKIFLTLDNEVVCGIRRVNDANRPNHALSDSFDPDAHVAVGDAIAFDAKDVKHDGDILLVVMIPHDHDVEKSLILWLIWMAQSG